MAMSLAFHIVFAVVGIGMPLLMVIAEGMWLRTREAVWLDLAKRWSKGTAIMFAVGAVSGTVLSFELGLLWPEFMAFAGPIIGMPFSLEGFAFFLEAIFLGIYLYGWDRVPERMHWFAGVMVMISGTLSGIFVVCANAWMNTPTGFTLEDGKLVHVDVWAAMFNPASFSTALHMTLASFVAIGFAVAGIHAWRLRTDPESEFHRRAFGVALAVGAVFSLLQPLSGHISAQHVAEHQPVKLAAMKAHWETERGAAYRIGGWPDVNAEKTTHAIEIPKLLSLLSFNDPNAEVRGLKAFPKDERPNVPVVHFAFQLMVACGVAMAGAGLLGLLLWWRRKRVPVSRPFLNLIVACAPMGIIAIQAGWVVTEVGRQPWIIHNIMRTADAVTPMPGLIIPFLAMSALYLILGVVAVVLVRRHVFAAP